MMGMTPERWQQIELIYDAASLREGADQSAFLDQACGNDGALRREIESLLVASREAGSFIETSAAALTDTNVASDILAGALSTQNNESPVPDAAHALSIEFASHVVKPA